MNPLTSLIAASRIFVGTHFALSHPLHSPLVMALGATGFSGLYSLVASASMAWMYFAFVAAGDTILGGSGDVGWVIATVLTLPALVLFLGSLRGNPPLPGPDAEKLTERKPAGVFAVTRDPMMWGFAFWALGLTVLTLGSGRDKKVVSLALLPGEPRRTFFKERVDAFHMVLRRVH